MNNEHKIEREQIERMIERDEDHQTVGDRIQAARDKRGLDAADCKRLYALNEEEARIERMIARGDSRDEIRSRIFAVQGHGLIGDAEADRLRLKICTSRDDELALIKGMFDKGRDQECMFPREASDDGDDGQRAHGGPPRF